MLVFFLLQSCNSSSTVDTLCRLYQYGDCGPAIRGALEFSTGRAPEDDDETFCSQVPNELERGNFTRNKTA